MIVPEALHLGVGLDEVELLLGATGEGQVVDRQLVDREDRARRAVLRGHVADGGAGLERERRHAGTVGLDELADDAVLAQQLGDREHDVGRGHALARRAGETKSDDRRDQHRGRLTEHAGLGLDAADAPAEHAEAVHHRRVRVGADQGVEVGDAVVFEDDAREVLEVDLVTDAHARGHDPELLEGALGPLQERVALDVALVLDDDVLVEALGGTGALQDHRVVDDEFDRHERIDLVRVAAEGDDGVAHRGQVDDGGHAGQVLHEDALGREGDLLRVLAGGLTVTRRILAPPRERLDVGGGDLDAVFVSQQVLQEHLDGVRQSVDAERGECVGSQRVVREFAASHVECLLRAEGVE